MNKTTLIAKLKSAVVDEKISKPGLFSVSPSFPLAIALTNVSLQSGCQPVENSLGLRIATGCSLSVDEAVFLSMAEGVERFSIQYSNNRQKYIAPVFSSNKNSPVVLQSMVCIGAPGAPGNTSIGSALGSTMEFATKNALLEQLEHFHLAVNSDNFRLLNHGEFSSIKKITEWLTPQYRKLSITVLNSSFGYFVTQCCCSDVNGGRATIGSAASESLSDAVFKAAAESIVFWRNMVSIEHTGIDMKNLNTEELLAVKQYRGAAESKALNSHSLPGQKSKKIVSKVPANKNEIDIESLIRHASDIMKKEISVFDLTDPILSIPVAKVRVQSR